MKTILFDIGNVLLAFDFAPALNSLQGANAEPNAYEKIIARKDRFEAGKEEKSNYITWASALLDYSGSSEDFERAWCSIFTPIKPMWELAESLKKAGYRIILFSNTNCIHAPHCLSTYPILAEFDGAVFSHEIQSIKPEDKFYQTAIEMYDLVPEETYYIDDLPANIEAGEKFGFTSFLYDHNRHDTFLTEFRNCLPV